MSKKQDFGKRPPKPPVMPPSGKGKPQHGARPPKSPPAKPPVKTK
ncbi:hypothetical protein [Rhodopirellula sp. MGV]|nr:hypothetical protein [Rhodopirellula sp. MGV]